MVCDLDDSPVQLPTIPQSRRRRKKKERHNHFSTRALSPLDVDQSSSSPALTQSHCRIGIMSATLERQRSRRMQVKPRSTRNLAGAGRHVGGSFRRFHTKEVNQVPSFPGNPISGCQCPNIEDLDRLKSFRQQSLRKMESLRKMPSFRKLETSCKLESSRDPSVRPDLSFRQVSFRQLDAHAFTEIANASFNGSSARLEASLTNGSLQCSLDESSHGLSISVIEFVQGEDELEAIEIEIAPGVYKRLKGSHETQIAWDNDGCIEAMCFVCDSILAVAPGCDSVICPNCYSISPVFKDETDLLSTESQDSWWLTLDDQDAVGLGIAIPEF